jgi:hypothetical protein
MPTHFDLGRATAEIGDQILIQGGQVILVKSHAIFQIGSQGSIALPDIKTEVCAAVSMNGEFSVFCTGNEMSNLTTLYVCSRTRKFISLTENENIDHITKVWISNDGKIIIAGTSTGRIRTFTVDVEGGFITSKINYISGCKDISFLQVKEIDPNIINIESCDSFGLLLSFNLLQRTSFQLLATTNVPDQFTPFFVDGEMIVFEHLNHYQQNLLRTEDNPIMTTGVLLRFEDIEKDDAMRTMVKFNIPGEDQELLITLTKGGWIRLWKTINKKPGLLLLPDCFRLPDNDYPIYMTMGIEETGKELLYVLGPRKVYCYTVEELLTISQITG